jgi:hypothetical protein
VTLTLQTEQQIGGITDALRTSIALGLPVLKGFLFALKGDRIERLGGYEKITLYDLAREYLEGTRDCGICFEYAVHDALSSRHPKIYPLVSTVIDEFCGLRLGAQSILFGAEKSGKWSLINTAQEFINEDSRVLSGGIGQPPKLLRLWNTLTRAMHVEAARAELPPSINGLWKSDLFLGSPADQRWVGATLKINKEQFVGSPGLRVGLYPALRHTDRPSLDANTNLVLCPLPYDGGFMEAFYASFFAVKAFLKSDAKTPPPVDVPYAHDRYFCQMLEARREHPVLEVLQAMYPMGQPGLVAEGVVGTADQEVSAVAPLPAIIA